MGCVYHADLYELEEVAAESGNEEQAQTFVSGRRLGDMSELPLGVFAFTKMFSDDFVAASEAIIKCFQIKGGF